MRHGFPRTRPGRRGRGRRGVALLLVLVVLLLVATLATEIALTARTHYRLADHSMNDFLLRSVVEGRRQILLAALRYDYSLDNGALDKEDDVWAWHDSRKLSEWGDTSGSTFDDPSAEEMGSGALRHVYRNRDVPLQAWCEDERGKLNLLGLLFEKDTPTYVRTREVLIRLIDLYRDPWSELDVADSDAESMVEDLEKWLAEPDSDDNPLPRTRVRQGRLLSLEDLFRVPGGKWTPEICYDVRDPRQTAEGDFSQRMSDLAPELTDDEETLQLDTSWERPNGVPGLFRYLTVWGEGTTGAQPKINVNTAPLPVLRALFSYENEELAEKIVEHRREGAGSDSTEAPSESSDAGGWFRQKSDLTKVEGMGDDLGRHPALDVFATTNSTVFSLRIIATVNAGRIEADEEDGGEAQDIVASYQYREVVQRAQQGFVSLHAERRNDPILGESK